MIADRAAPPGKPTRRPWRHPCFRAGALVFLAALGLRLAYTVEYTRSIGIDYYTFEQTDNHTFHEWAQRIAAGDWLCRNQVHPFHKWTAEVAPEAQWLAWYGGPRVYHQAPLYPYVMAGLFALLGPRPLYARLFQALLGALTALIVFLSGRHLFGRNTGLAAGLLLAFCGFHFFYDAFLLREGLITFLTAAFFYLALRALREPRPGRLIPAGVFLGLDAAAKPIAFLLLPCFAAAFLLLRRNDPFVKRVLRAGVFGCAFILPLAPFYARNAALGVPVLRISTRGPTAFINGNLRGQEGSVWNPPAAEVRRILQESNYRLGGTLLETLRSYTDDPLAFLEQLRRKTAAFLEGYEYPNNTNFYLIRGVSRVLRLGVVPYGGLTAAALLGMLLLLPVLRRTWPLYLVSLVFGLATVAFFVVARFRQPVVPFFALFGGYALAWTASKVRARRFAAAAAALLLFGLCLAGIQPGEHPYETEASVRSGMMKKLAIQGDFGRAERYARELLEIYRGEYARYLPVLEGRLHAIENAFESFREARRRPEGTPERSLLEAEGYLSLMDVTKRVQFEELAERTEKTILRALAGDPGIPEAHRTLGLCLLKHAARTKDGEKKVELTTRALLHFRKELERNPDDGEALKAAGFCCQALGAHRPAAAFYTRFLSRPERWDPKIAAQTARAIVLAVEEPGEKLLARALDLVEEALEEAPDDTAILQIQAFLLEKRGCDGEARRVLERLRRLDPASLEEYRKGIERLKEREAGKDAGGESEPSLKPGKEDGTP